MDPKLKADWVAALRSGEYRQGKGCLYKKTPSGDAYCCLGVLAKVAAYEFRPLDQNGQSNGLFSNGRDVGYTPFFLNLARDQVPILWKMNDHDETSFSEIADYIERTL